MSSTVFASPPVDSSEFTQQVYQRWLAYGKGFARSRFGIKGHDAEDIFQTAMLLYLGKKDDPKYARTSSFGVFTGFFRNCCYDFIYELQKKQRINRRLADGLEVHCGSHLFLHEGEVSTSLTSFGIKVRFTPGAIDSIIAREEASTIAHVLDNIHFENPTFQRIYDLLRAGKTRADIVTLYPDMNLGSLDGRIHRIRQTIVQAL